MHRGSPFIAILVMAAFWVAALSIPIGTIYAEEGQEAAANSFLGVKKCKTCHKSTKSGAQFPHWESTAHAKAFETLKSDAAAAIAKEKGLAVPAFEAPECLECHTTGFGVPAELQGAKLTLEEGVSCEACHGAGSAYYKKKTMVAVTAGEVDGASVGLTMPDEALCVSCHNDKSPTFEAFDFNARIEDVKHPEVAAEAK